MKKFVSKWIESLYDALWHHLESFSNSWCIEVWQDLHILHYPHFIGYSYLMDCASRCVYLQLYSPTNTIVLAFSNIIKLFCSGPVALHMPLQWIRRIMPCRSKSCCKMLMGEILRFCHYGSDVNIF